MLHKMWVVLLLLLVGSLPAEVVRFKRRCLDDLAVQVPKILASQDRATGRFGSGIWIVTDQNVMLPLAAAWSYKDAANPHYRSGEVLDAIMAAGDALIADQDPTGKWEFRKKDGSTWGSIYMPWTYSRWIRAYALVREAMPADRRAKWDKALRLGYTGIAGELKTARMHNIPAHHAMGLYFAGKVFNEPAWCTQARDFERRIAASQHPDGYWSEHTGPVVLYGAVYVEALGTYLAASKDEAVLPALRKSGAFHAHFTYPDGSDVETIDERNPYHEGVRVPNVGFTFSPLGRSYLARQLRLHKEPIEADAAASLLLWGEEGPGADRDPATSDFDYVLGSGDAAVRRRGPWFLVVSAIPSPVPTIRWIQDRQNFVSVYHDKAGLILGGGNTKLQPGWSNFTLGDTALFRHRAGDEQPDFTPPAGLVHVPVSARLLKNGDFGVELDYGKARGRIRLVITGPDRLEYEISGDSALVAHITAMPRMGLTLTAATGQSQTLGTQSFLWNTPGDWIAVAGVRMRLPARTTVRWPVLPHNPYRKDGSSEAGEGRIVLDVPLAGPRMLVVELNR